MNYYIADTHLGHFNIIRFSKRPFKSVEEMDEAIIKKWNAKVTNEDDVYIIGDFSYKGGNPDKYLKRLNGKKHLITGNHDRSVISDCRKYFVEICDYKELNENGKRLVLFHYPIVDWNGRYSGSYHFYGHVHNTFHNEPTEYASKMPNAYNVGVDVIGFEPKTFEEIVGKK